MQTYLNNPKNKPVVFMLSAAVGCLAAALLAEAFLLLLPKGKTVEAVEQQSICLTIDVSGSMMGSPMKEMKAAAQNFVDKRAGDKLALTAFSDDAAIIESFASTNEDVKNAIDDLEAEGMTNFAAAFEKSEKVFEELAGSHKTLLLFTDGENTVGNPDKAVEIAARLRDKKVRIFAIGTAEADGKYLAKLTGSKDHVFFAQSGELDSAFTKAEAKIHIASTVGSGRDSHTLVFIETAGWTVFAALGIALALVALQNYYLKKPILPTEQLSFVAAGAVLAGLAAGFIAQMATTVLSAIHLGEIGRVLAWSVLGGLLAFGMVFVIPNLDKAKALGFGALGGFLGSLGFLLMTTMTGMAGGRLLGAALLGACIGLLVAIVETLYRKVWLMAVYDPRHVSQVNLGTQAVTVGSGRGDTVPIVGVETKAGSFVAAGGDTVQFTDSQGTQSLVPGDRVMVGNVELVICSKEVPFSPSKFYPMKMSRARELMNR